MYISLGNDITSLTVSSDSNSSYTTDTLLTTSFSEVYLSNGSATNFDLEITITNPDYLAITGNNIFDTCSSVEIAYWTGSAYTNEDTVTPEWNHTIVHKVQNNATKYRFRFVKSDSTQVVSLAYVSAGSFYEIPNNGEQVGYSYAWTLPQTKQRTAMMDGSPTATILQDTSIQGSLSIAHHAIADVRTTWQPFQKEALKNGFFILEDESYPEEGYYCFDVKNQPSRAHGQTRQLKVSSISYSCWTGNNVS